MMKKFYAVRVGRETGIFEDWTSCEKQIKGFSGAEYKSFKRREEAEAYLLAFQKKSTPDAAASRCYPCAYIDGSYDAATHRYAYGAVILTGPEETACFSQSFADQAAATMHNVAGELQGSIFAISYAMAQGWPQLDIYFDYNGIEKWATGEWKRNLPATQAYHAFCQDAFQHINIRFIKVKGHSGDKYNDMADALAREALNL